MRRSSPIPRMPGRSSPSRFRTSATSAPTKTTSRPSTWRRRRARAASSCAPTSPSPSNFRATRHLDQWLKARGVIGLCGLDTRALTALIRQKGMPNAVIAHEASGKFDLDALKKEAREWPGLVGMDLVPMVTIGPALHLGRDALAMGQGLRPPDQAGIPRGRNRLRHQAQHPAPAGQRRLQGHGGAGEDRRPRKFSRSNPTACSSPTAPAIRRRPGNTPCR